MDIEGSEPETIKGAAKLLNTAKPMLAACVYHRWEHLWEVPLLIHSLTRDHKLFLAAMPKIAGSWFVTLCRNPECLRGGSCIRNVGNRLPSQLSGAR